MKNTAALIETLSRAAGAATPAPHPVAQSIHWLWWAALYLATALLISGLRPDLLTRLQVPWFATELTVLIVLLVAGAVSTALLSFPDLHQMRRIACAPAYILALFLLTLLIAGYADNPATPLPRHTYECTLCILLVALPPAAWTFLKVQRFASTHHRWTGGVVVLSALSLGALWVRLFELNDSIAHVVQWHYLPMIGFGIAGLWLGKVMLKW